MAYRHRITGKFVGAGFAEANPALVIPPFENSGSEEPTDRPLAREAQMSQEEDQISMDIGDDGVSTLSLRDRVTVRNATDLQEAALSVAARTGDAVLNCAGLTHLDTAAAQVLIALRKQIASSSTEMQVRELDPSVQKILDDTGLWARLAT